MHYRATSKCLKKLLYGYHVNKMNKDQVLIKKK